ncbi:MAG: CpsD/CapB family tyrosine-protein kinase [Candidatus Brocadiaceae bacterium]|nr:CpsD/CapB family tyrosine-protein kinase [Candidatus Brocadiaceae bacterium]
MEHQSTSRDSYLIVHQLPRSGVAESFCNIRTKLLFSSPDRELKTILFTSALPGEGKTFSAISMGIVMAQTGKRVLLVDADQRRPTLGKAFSLGSQAENMGLSSLVMRRVPAESAIFKTGIENLSVLPAGPKPPNPSELLGSQSTKETLEKLRSEFDMLIIDTPPVLGLPDTLPLVSMVDGCLLVIRYAKTSYKSILRVKESIRMVKGHFLGAILNMVKPEPFGYYYGGYHGYYYHKYYEEETQTKIPNSGS